MDYEKQALAPSAPVFPPTAGDADTFYPPLENPPPYCPYPAKQEFQNQAPPPQSGFAATVQQPQAPTGRFHIYIKFINICNS